MNQEDNEFDFQAAPKAIQAGKPLLGKEGILRGCKSNCVITHS